MKRSPLKRSGKRLNRRSKTNSRPHENLALRQRYIKEHPSCELTPILLGCGQTEWDFYRSAWGDVGFAIMDPNHIFSEGMRPDYWWNLIAACRPAHDWFHKCPIEGRIASVCVKARKGEVDLSEFKRVFGFELKGWLENHSGSVPFFERLRVETLELL